MLAYYNIWRNSFYSRFCFWTFAIAKMFKQLKKWDWIKVKPSYLLCTYMIVRFRKHLRNKCFHWCYIKNVHIFWKCCLWQQCSVNIVHCNAPPLQMTRIMRLNEITRSLKRLKFKTFLCWHLPLIILSVKSGENSGSFHFIRKTYGYNEEHSHRIFRKLTN